MIEGDEGKFSEKKEKIVKKDYKE